VGREGCQRGQGGSNAARLRLLLPSLGQDLKAVHSNAASIVCARVNVAHAAPRIWSLSANAEIDPMNYK